MIRLTDCDASVFKNATVLIPTISVGNVSQLTVDLIITNVSAKRIGSFWHKAFIPYVGANSYTVDKSDEQSKHLSCTIELYYAAQQNIVIFQIRSPYANKHDIKDCVKELVSVVKSWDVARLIVLTGAYDHCRLPSEIDDTSENSRYRYLESPEFAERYHSEIEGLDWKRYLEGQRLNDASDHNPHCLKHAGAGFADTLFAASIENKVPTIVLLNFTADGFNDVTALKFLKFVNSWLHLLSTGKVSYPYSWKYLMDHPSVPMETDIYHEFNNCNLSTYLEVQ